MLSPPYSFPIFGRCASIHSRLTIPKMANCPLRAAALASPHFPALQTADGTLSFSELDRLVDKTAATLSLREGERLAVLLPTGIQFLAHLFAAIRLGAAFCPLSPRLPPRELTAALQRLAPTAFVSSDGVKILPSTAKSPPSSFLLFTSGSSGMPKIAILTLEHLLASARAAVHFLSLQSNDRWLLSLPLHHVGGLGILFRCLLARAVITLQPSDPFITHLSYVPTQLYRAWPIYPQLRAILLGGAPICNIPQELPIISTYGMTETSSLVLARKNSAHFLGFPLRGRELKLAEDGELLVRGNTVFQGYLNEPSPFDADGWFPTKDLAVFDPQEGFAIAGRKDNQFISGGENIQPEEIERALLQHPAVLEVIIAPKADPEFGFRPVAYVRSVDETFDLNTMQRFLLDRLPKYKIPIALFSLPETALKPSRKGIFEMVNNKNLIG